MWNFLCNQLLTSLIVVIDQVVAILILIYLSIGQPTIQFSTIK